MTQPALLADALTVRLGMTDPVDILDGISFRLEAGRTLAVASR